MFEGTIRMFMDWVKKVTDVIMPLEPLPEDDDTDEAQEKEVTKTTEHTTDRNVSGMSANRPAESAGDFMSSPVMNVSDSGTMTTGGMRYTAYADRDSGAEQRPNLTVVKTPELSVRIYTPVNFDDAREIADGLLGQRAAVVNYEHVSSDEQRRISDFVNGVCYASDGVPEIVSEKILLYVPAGVEAKDIAAATATRSMRGRF